MSDLQSLHAKLDEVLTRLKHLEGGSETEIAGWVFLVARPHPWQRQLSVKGRNLTVGQLMSTIRANGLTPDQASDAFDLPVAAIQEAITYYDQNRSLIELEATEERSRLARKGYKLEPQSVPR
jgi:uncharacterized protein (DUF433 family)